MYKNNQIDLCDIIQAIFNYMYFWELDMAMFFIHGRYMIFIYKGEISLHCLGVDLSSMTLT